MDEEKPFEITLDASECVNFAMQQNDIPLIRDLRLKNIGSSDLGNLKISIRSEPEVIKPIEFLLENLSIGTAAAASDLNPKLQREVLRKQNERELGELIVEIRSGERILQNHTQRLEILACNEWPGLRILPEFLAAFIMPNNQAIAPILSAAGEILKKSPGNNSSITAYQKKDPTRALLEAAAIYEALANVRITYINPPASFEQTGQKIRLPDQILSAKLGTCLDLALLYASCLEQAGLNPLVVLMDGHAFTAVWLKDESFSHAVVKDAAALKKRIDLGEIAAIEATALTGDTQKL